MAVHADPDTLLFKQPHEGLDGELTSLVRVEDLGPALVQGFLRGRHLEVGPRVLDRRQSIRPLKARVEESMAMSGR